MTSDAPWKVVLVKAMPLSYGAQGKGEITLLERRHGLTARRLCFCSAMLQKVGSFKTKGPPGSE